MLFGILLCLQCSCHSAWSHLSRRGLRPLHLQAFAPALPSVHNGSRGVPCVPQHWLYPLPPCRAWFSHNQRTTPWRPMSPSKFWEIAKALKTGPRSSGLVYFLLVPPAHCMNMAMCPLCAWTWIRSRRISSGMTCEVQEY